MTCGVSLGRKAGLGVPWALPLWSLSHLDGLDVPVAAGAQELQQVESSNMGHVSDLGAAEAGGAAGGGQQHPAAPPHSGSSWWGGGCPSRAHVKVATHMPQTGHTG